MDGLGAAGEFAETLPALNQVRAVVDVALSRGVGGTARGLTRQVVNENKRTKQDNVILKRQVVLL